MRGNRILIVGLILCAWSNSFAQRKDSLSLNSGEIYGYALNADIKLVLKMLDTARIEKAKDLQLKRNFENRFKYETDKTDYFVKADTTLNPLNRVFQQYWRKALLDNTASYDDNFKEEITTFFRDENSKHPFTGHVVDTASLEPVYMDYITTKHYHTAGWSKTGNLYDLLVWKKETDTTYKIKEINDTAFVNVHLMDQFFSLGWEEYATIGVYYPGGWATPASLFCVKKGYDLNSEDFLVSYLAHEGRHFLDYKQFPKLSSNDLEYRAKLTELYLADSSLYAIIQFFINNGKYDKANPHPYADFCVIRDMSLMLFNRDFEKDINRWKSLNKMDIHRAAKKLFVANTTGLNKAGLTVVDYVK